MPSLNSTTRTDSAPIVEMLQAFENMVPHEFALITSRLVEIVGHPLSILGLTWRP